jgi:Tfp pilus assembly protein PilW
MVVTICRRAGQSGLALIELLAAVAMSAIVLAALNSLVSLAASAQAAGRGANELAYQGRFALERIASQARATTPKALSAPAANTTGDWFAPTGCTASACVMYCLNGGGQLIETTTGDTGCAGSKVIAVKVTAFSVQVPAAMGAVDRYAGAVSLSLADAATGSAATLSSQFRLGGGTQ